MRGKVEQREEGEVDSPVGIWEGKVPVRGNLHGRDGEERGGKKSVSKVLSWSVGAAENQTVRRR